MTSQKTQRIFFFCGNTTRISVPPPVQNQVARTFTDSYFFGNFRDSQATDFDESQRTFSQLDRRGEQEKCPQGPNLDSRAAGGGQQSSHASSKIHG